jgi:L-2-hydroxyglutarate oxidase LhgO
VGRPVNRLIYPVPEQAGKGIHISLSLDGGMKLGPNVKYVDQIDYAVDESDKVNFYRAAHRYLPLIELDDLSPDFAGIRPKLQGPGEDFRDFVITDESARGLPGLIDLIGIESPGLTSSPAIGRYVAAMVDKYFK